MSLTKASFSMINGAVYNVLDYGAKGDGVNDDTSAIQAALDTAFNSGGGKVFVPAGVFRTSKPLIVRSNTVLEGTGKASVLKQSANFNGPGNVLHVGYGYEWNQNGQSFNPASNDDATMAQILADDYSKLTTVNAGARNLYLEGYINGNRPGLGLWFINALNCFCEYIWAKDVLIPVTVGNDAPGWQAASVNTTVSNVYQVSCNPTTDGTDAGSFSWFDLMYIGSSVGTHASHLYNNPNTPAALNYFIQTAGACRFTIADSFFSGDNSSEAIGLFSNSIQNTFSGNVLNNTFENVSVGVSLIGTGGGGSQISGCSVVGNTFRDCQDTVVVVGSTSGNNNISSNLYGANCNPPYFGVTYANTTFGTYNFGPWFLNTTANTSPESAAVIFWDSGLGEAGVSFLDNDSTNVGRFSQRFFRAANLVGSIQTLLNSTVYATSSDYRLKENIVPLTGALDRVSKIKPVSFNWKSNGDKGESFIAHELQEFFPAAVTGKKDECVDIGNVVDAAGTVIRADVTEPKVLPEGQSWVKTGETPVYQGVDASVLVPVLVAAIQELKKQFDAYKALH